MKKSLWWMVLAMALGACGDDETQTADAGADVRLESDAGETPDEGTATNNGADAGVDLGESDLGSDVNAGDTNNSVNEVCRTPAADNRTRKLVVGRPYDENADRSPVYVVHNVSATGEVSPVVTQFELGTAFSGKIQFTPDGELGFVRLEDGKVGVFRFLPDGNVEVVNAGWAPSQYVSKVVVDPSGQYLYMLNTGWRNVNGGIYRAKIDCKTGELTDEGLVAASKLPTQLVFQGSERAFLAGVDVLDSEAPNHVHELAVGETLSRVASGSAFTTEDVGLAGFAVTPDAKFAVVGDAGLFSNNSVSVVSLGANIAQVQNFVVGDPQDIVVSPFNNAAIVLATQEDNILVFDVDTATTEPLNLRGNLQRQVPFQLPTDAVMIERGDLRGHVFISENVAIRQVAFRPSGTVDDLGVTSNGAGLQAISGAIGIQP